MKAENDADFSIGAACALSLKQANLRAVLREIYHRKSATKLELAQSLGMSIPTVTTCLNTFISEGLVVPSKTAVYTGGRKAKVYDFNALSRISIGVKLLKEGASAVAIDLYGSVLEESYFDHVFEDNDEYYMAFGKWVNAFSSALPYSEDEILGVCIALQGLVSSDGEYVHYTEILKSPGIRRKTFQDHISLKVSLMHDLDAAAYYEMLTREDISNAIYMILNKNFGGVMIYQRSIRQLLNVSSGTLEHISIDPDGPLCYCGNRGCVETFCSVDRLEEMIAPLSLVEFFSKVHSKSAHECEIWGSYLDHLALAINNVRMVINLDVLIGGYLVQFIDEDDILELKRRIDKAYPFNRIGSVVLKVSKHTDEAIKLGAAMSLVEKAIKEY